MSQLPLPPKMNIYLAGKVAGDKWQTVAKVRNRANFIASDGGRHSEHNFGTDTWRWNDNDLRNAVKWCFVDCVRKCSHLIAYLNCPTSFGSIAEIAYASSLGIPCSLFVIMDNHLPCAHHDACEVERDTGSMFDTYWFVSHFPQVEVFRCSSLADATSQIGRHVYRITHRDYLQSEQWKQLSSRAKQNAGNRCQLCNSSGRLETHHRTYERWGKELLTDLIVLCNKCHEKFHDKGAA